MTGLEKILEATSLCETSVFSRLLLKQTPDLSTNCCSTEMGEGLFKVLGSGSHNLTEKISLLEIFRGTTFSPCPHRKIKHLRCLLNWIFDSARLSSSSNQFSFLIKVWQREIRRICYLHGWYNRNWELLLAMVPPISFATIGVVEGICSRRNYGAFPILLF